MLVQPRFQWSGGDRPAERVAVSVQLRGMQGMARVGRWRTAAEQIGDDGLQQCGRDVCTVQHGQPQRPMGGGDQPDAHLAALLLEPPSPIPGELLVSVHQQLGARLPTAARPGLWHGGVPSRLDTTPAVRAGAVGALVAAANAAAWISRCRAGRRSVPTRPDFHTAASARRRTLRPERRKAWRPAACGWWKRGSVRFRDGWAMHRLCRALRTLTFHGASWPAETVVQSGFPCRVREMPARGRTSGP